MGRAVLDEPCGLAIKVKGSRVQGFRGLGLQKGFRVVAWCVGFRVEGHASIPRSTCVKACVPSTLTVPLSRATLAFVAAFQLHISAA